jgi:FtsH-binding integral membrane protein
MATKDYDRYRILYIGPTGVGVAVTIAAFVFLGVSEVLRTTTSSADFEWDGVLLGTIGALVASVIGAFAFNIVAPMIGGIPLWLRTDTSKLAGKEKKG